MISPADKRRRKRYARGMMANWVAAAIAHKKLTDPSFSQAELSRRLAERMFTEPDRSIVNKMVKGIRDVSASEMLAIEEITGYRAPTKVEGSVTKVPHVTWVSGGRLDVRDGVMSEQVEKFYTVANLPPGDWIALTVEGDSMDRISPDGSIIIVNRRDTDLVDGKYYIFANDRDHSTTYKQFRENPFRLVPQSVNPRHEPIFIPEDDSDFRCVGRVWLTIQEL